MWRAISLPEVNQVEMSLEELSDPRIRYWCHLVRLLIMYDKRFVTLYYGIKNTIWLAALPRTGGRPISAHCGVDLASKMDESTFYIFVAKSNIIKPYYDGKPYNQRNAQSTQIIIGSLRWPQTKVRACVIHTQSSRACQETPLDHVNTTQWQLTILPFVWH
jgi:hypothetical protein